MRIVQVATFYSPTSGGLRVAVDRLRAGYVAAGDVVTTIVPGPITSRQVDVAEIRAPRIPHSGGYRIIVNRRALLRTLDESEPELLEVHDKLLLPWVRQFAKRHGLPVVAVSHERLDATLGMLLPVAPRRIRSRTARLVMRETLASADYVVACSRFAAAEFQRSSRLRIVPLGVNTHRFRPDPRVEDQLDWHARPLRLVTASRLSAEKRPDMAIATLAALQSRGVQAELVLVGSGPQRRRLQRLAAGRPVHFEGFVNDTRLAELLAGADVALAPGPAETFGLAALEALACGTPVVVVKDAATAELIEDHPHAGRTSVLEHYSFADAVLDLLSDPTRRPAARAAAKTFPWERSVRSMREIHTAAAQRAGVSLACRAWSEIDQAGV
jgi:alpha-1,6-mannosyltransferase